MIGGINIKSRIFRVVLYTASAMRIKHYRGHGIHSPFVYSMIRLALMKRRLTAADHSLYDELRQVRCSRRVARQLQNIFNYCKYRDYRVICSLGRAEGKVFDGDFVVVMHTVPPEATRQIIRTTLCANTAVAVVYPRNNRARYRVCKQEVDTERYLSIDNRRFMLFFSDERWQIQHFKL